MWVCVYLLAPFLRRLISTCSLSGIPYIFNIISYKAWWFSKKSNEHEILLLIFLQILSEMFLILRIIPIDIIVRVQRYFCKITVVIVRFQLTFFWQIFEKNSNIIFHENMSRFNWVVPCGQRAGQTGVLTARQTDRQTDSHYNIWPLIVFILERIFFSSYELRPAKKFSQLRQRMRKQLSTESDRL